MKHLPSNIITRGTEAAPEGCAAGENCCRSGLQGRNVAGKHKECLHRDNGIQGSRENVALGDGSAATDTFHMPAEVMGTWLTLHE